VELKPFHKTFGKIASSSGALIGAAWSYIFVAAPPKWKPQMAPGAAPRLELLDFKPFGKAPARAGFEALPNRTFVSAIKP
jgi:hypothetical protein